MNNRQDAAGSNSHKGEKQIMLETTFPRRVRKSNLTAPAWPLVLMLIAPSWAGAQDAEHTRIDVDAQKVEGPISPMLYGQFMELMFEDVKGGLYAELLRDRSFEDPPNAIGLSRYWERDPDDRDDDSALKFHWDDSVYFPPVTSFDSQGIDHSLRITVSEKSDARRGIRQGGIPLREGIEYHGYFWLKSLQFEGHITAALE